MLILASQSPRRAALLKILGIESFVIRPADINETALPKELPAHQVRRLARQKAEEVFLKTQEHGNNRIVLAADTLVSLGRRVIEAPWTEEANRFCLNRLSGRSHCVHTSVVVASTQGVQQKNILTRVVFKSLCEEEKNQYVRSQEGIGKAGGYSIQGFAGSFVKRLNGSWSGVVGLPLLETRSLLMSAGLPIWPPCLEAAGV